MYCFICPLVSGVKDAFSCNVVGARRIPPNKFVLSPPWCLNLTFLVSPHLLSSLSDERDFGFGDCHGREIDSNAAPQASIGLQVTDNHVMNTLNRDQGVMSQEGISNVHLSLRGVTFATNARRISDSDAKCLVLRWSHLLFLLERVRVHAPISGYREANLALITQSLFYRASLEIYACERIIEKISIAEELSANAQSTIDNVSGLISGVSNEIAQNRAQVVVCLRQANQGQSRISANINEGLAMDCSDATEENIAGVLESICISREEMRKQARLVDSVTSRVASLQAYITNLSLERQSLYKTQGRAYEELQMNEGSPTGKELFSIQQQHAIERGVWGAGSTGNSSTVNFHSGSGVIRKSQVLSELNFTLGQKEHGVQAKSSLVILCVVSYISPMINPINSPDIILFYSNMQWPGVVLPCGDTKLPRVEDKFERLLFQERVNAI
ncbi:hypothetical protein BDZ97DRAFT_1762689 [Flammula alnicola]|nr:hypothetical protein BDZ97DRAFT_1762689 [Flammula alnicola]